MRVVRYCIIEQLVYNRDSEDAAGFACYDRRGIRHDRRKIGEACHSTELGQSFETLLNGLFPQ